MHFPLVRAGSCILVLFFQLYWVFLVFVPVGMFPGKRKQSVRSHSLTDRTQDSDSCNVGSIPAGCIEEKGLESLDFESFLFL